MATGDLATQKHLNISDVLGLVIEAEIFKKGEWEICVVEGGWR